MLTIRKKWLAILGCLLGVSLLFVSVSLICVGYVSAASATPTPVTVTSFVTNNDNIVVLDTSEEVYYEEGEMITVYLNDVATEIALSVQNDGNLTLQLSKGTHRRNDAEYWHVRIPEDTVFGDFVLSEDYNLYNLRNVNGTAEQQNEWIIRGQESTIPFALTGITGYASNHAGASRWYIALGVDFENGTPENLVDLIYNWGIIYATENDDIEGNYTIYGASENNININAEINGGTATALGVIINWSVLGETSGETGYARMFKIPCGTVWGGYHGAYRLTHDVWLFYNGSDFTFLDVAPQFVDGGSPEVLADQTSNAGFSFILDENAVPTGPNWDYISYQTSNQECKFNGNGGNNAIIKKYADTEYYVDLAQGGITAQDGDYVTLNGFFRYENYFYEIVDTSFSYDGGIWGRIAPEIIIAIAGTQVDSDTLAVEIGTPRSDLTASARDFFDDSINVTIDIPTEAVSGDAFVAGTYVVTFTATDSHGYMTKIERTLKVADTIAPVITVTSVTTEYNEGQSLTYEVSATDNIDESVQVVLVAPDGMTDEDGKLLPGEWVIRFSATDSAANTSVSDDYTITVADITPPTITFGTDSVRSFEAGTAYEKSAILSAIAVEATDNYDTKISDIDLVMPQGAVEDEILQAGTWSITIHAYDAAENMGTATIQIYVNDTVAPIITVDDSATKINYTEGEVPVIVANASDSYDGDVEVTITYPDGALDEDGKLTLGTGEWTVVINAEDSAGNAAEEVSLKIFINERDSVAPVITIKGKTEYTAGEDFALTATAIDEVDGVVQVDVSVPSDALDADGKLIAGTWTITFTATDAAGNDATETVEIVVAETDATGGCSSSSGIAGNIALISVLLCLATIAIVLQKRIKN